MKNRRGVSVVCAVTVRVWLIALRVCEVACAIWLITNRCESFTAVYSIEFALKLVSYCLPHLKLVIALPQKSKLSKFWHRINSNTLVYMLSDVTVMITMQWLIESFCGLQICICVVSAVVPSRVGGISPREKFSSSRGGNSGCAGNINIAVNISHVSLIIFYKQFDLIGFCIVFTSLATQYRLYGLNPLTDKSVSQFFALYI